MQTDNSVGRALNPSRWIGLAAITIAMLTGALIFTSTPADTDLWGHVQFGRDKLEFGLDRTTTYSYITSDYPWINHEHLSEILMALVVDSFGPIGLVVAKLCLGIAILLMIWYVGRDLGANSISIACTLILVSANLLTGWMARPKLLTFFCFAVLISVLHRAFKKWERHSESDENVPMWDRSLYVLCCLPLLFVFWTNAHGGFVAGIVVFATYLGLRFIQTWLEHRKDAWRLGIFLLFIGVCCGAATLVNPYGWYLHRWLIGSLGAARPEILEWNNLGVATPSGLNVTLLVVVAIFTSVYSHRKLDIVHVLVMLAVAAQAFLHIRHVPFLAMLFGFWWVTHLDGFLSPQPFLNKLSKGAAKFILAVCCLIVAVQISLLAPQLRGIKVSRARYPVGAFKFIAEHHLDGRAFVSFDWAQYAIGVFGSRNGEEKGKIQVAYDGRFRTCYPQDIIDYGFDFELGGAVKRNRSAASEAFDEGKVTRIGEPNLLLIHRNQGNAIQAVTRLNRENEWVLLYQDSIAQLWGRAAIYDDVQNARYFSLGSRIVGNTLQKGAVWWPADPKFNHPD